MGVNNSVSRTDGMRPMHQANTMSSKPRKAILLGTSALVCLTLAAPVMAGNVATDFTITSSDGTTNGVGIAAAAINGSDTVSLGIALTTTGGNVGIKTTNNDKEPQSNTVTVTGTGSITTGTGTGAHGIRNSGNNNKTTVSGTVKATGAKSVALYNRSGDGNSFTLNEGATIIGDIVADDNSSNSKLIFNLGASTSYA